MSFIIAIDGHSSCGKSTLARALARELNDRGFVFIDSGAMYRAVTLYFLRNGIALDDTKRIGEALADIRIDLLPDAESTRILLNGEDVSDEIRQMHVSERVSEVSAVKEVRHAMVAQQQQLGQSRNIVMDGRDIGTTVFPNADLKIFMTARPQVRAARRFAELTAKGEKTTLETVLANLSHRDHIDSTRTESPLRQAEDAIVLDNSDIDQREQLEEILRKIALRTCS